ncbi:uncharacterized protein LOC133515655 [Cydia pomonella]|uniref:uncharacterized protein LOC133515655 n=1 Tax=Cydia pomonella TaxID=82600 RepID=UPI002ADE88E0|nr:uncharacterized protein LOC133515655 [Cydia pomonella]
MLDTIKLQHTPLKKINSFKYFGSVISSDRSIDADIIHRINTGWMKWKELSGVLCDNRMPVHMKGKLYKAAVRPATECWPLKKKQEDKLHTAEMRMLRVRNIQIRGSFRVKPIPDKLEETRLRWYGHVMRRPPNHMTQKVLQIYPPPSTRRGRTRQTWMATINKDLNNAKIPVQTTRDRLFWRKITRRVDPK